MLLADFGVEADLFLVHGSVQDIEFVNMRGQVARLLPKKRILLIMRGDAEAGHTLPQQVWVESVWDHSRVFFADPTS